jgi:outer membrane protein, heavy metal efflux system
VLHDWRVLRQTELVQKFMRAFDPSEIPRLVTALCGVALMTFVMTGCKGIATQGERRAGQDLKTVGDSYRPQNRRPALPTLQTNATLSNFIHFALLNQPQVEAAYYDWAASVQRITVERSLPDPRLTFETDIADRHRVDKVLVMLARDGREGQK